MLLLHPPENVARPATPKPTAPKTGASEPSTSRAAPPKDSLGFTPLHKPTPPRDVLVGFAPQMDLLQYSGTDVRAQAPHIQDAVRCQASDRVCRKQSALAGGSVGGLVGLLAGCAAGPFFPLGAAGGALVGAAVGAAAPYKEAASFGQVRKHLFFKSGIVSSRVESAALVAALKKNKILRKGRERDILALQDLDAVLESQPYLKAKQRRQVRECLEFVARESANFDALTQERIRVQSAIVQARKSQRASKAAPGADLQALYNRQALIDGRLLAGAQVSPGRASAPRAVHQKPQGQQPKSGQPKALPSGPQHVHVGRNA